MDAQRYLNLDITVAQTEHGYVVALSGPVCNGSGSFASPFTALEIENLMLRIGQSHVLRRRIDSPEQAAVRTFGEKLFGAVFAGDLETCYRANLNHADQQGNGLRLRLRLSDAPALVGLPWEYLYDPEARRFPVLSSKTPIVRYLDLPGWVRPLAVAPPLRLLAVIASPRDRDPLDTEREWNRLAEALTPLQQRGLLVIERLESPTVPALQRQLRRNTYHMLHFVGHGGFSDEMQDGMLIFEDESGDSYRSSAEEVGALLHDHSSLRLVMLNACEGGRASVDDPLSGVAQSLVCQGVPAVIAMQFEVSDATAVTLSHEFYSAITDGLPVDAALGEARKAIDTQSDSVEWGTPVLYLRASDGTIFGLPPSDAPLPKPVSLPQPVIVRDTSDTPAPTVPPLSPLPARGLVALMIGAALLAIIVAGTWALQPKPPVPPPPTLPATTPATATTGSTAPVVVATATTTSTQVLVAPSATATDTPVPATATASPTSTPTQQAVACSGSVPVEGGFALLLRQQPALARQLGCVEAAMVASDYAEQPFERGSMLWFKDNDTIYVLFNGSANRWRRFTPESQRNRPTPTPEQPPEGYYRPINGFGLIWGSDDGVGRGLGWATAQETGARGGAFQRFANGAMIYTPTGLGNGKTIYVLLDNGTWQQFDDPNVDG